jgi:mRNA-degrading endonuclease RelE of RelBE toxin-antitoxin system
MVTIAKYTSIYKKSIAKLINADERYDLEQSIMDDPKAHPVIPGTGGIRKARFASHNKGKRGGSRLCYYYLEINYTVYFLKAYAKNEQIDLSPTDKKRLSALVIAIKAS